MMPLNSVNPYQKNKATTDDDLPDPGNVKSCSQHTGNMINFVTSEYRNSSNPKWDCWAYDFNEAVLGVARKMKGSVTISL